MLRLKMTIYATVYTEITSARGLMSLHIIEYSVCWKTVTLVTIIKIFFVFLYRALSTT
jgi:hypothetical protein